MNAPAVVASHSSSSSSSTSAHGKRLRPPTLTVSTTPPSNMRPPKTVIELETPAVEDPPPSLPLTMPTSASASSPAAGNTPYASALSALTPFREADVRRHGPQLSGDLSRDLAVLEQLRRSVQKNLMLRPLRSSPTSSPSSQPPSRPLSISSTWSDYQTPTSPSSASSVYFTPITDRAPTAPSLSAHFLNTAAANAAAVAAGLPSASAVKPPPIALEPALIARRLSAPIRPLLIDTRPVGPYLTAHIKGSINMSIPSLILKRSRQPGKGFQSLDALRQYITTDEGREVWDALVQPASEWDGDVVVFDDDMDESDRDNPQVTAWALLPVIAPLLLHGSVDYLRGGMSAARAHRDIHPFLVEGDNHKTPLPSPPIPLAPGQRSAPQTATSPPLPPPQLSLPPKRRGATLPMLNTADAAKQGKPLPEIERSAGPQSAISSASSIVPSHPWATLADATPSPPPSQSTFPRRKASQPTLAKLNTKSAERLTVSIPHHAPRSASSTSGRSSRSGSNASLLPPLALALPPHPPSPAPPGLKLVHSNHAPSAPGSSSPLSSREPSPLPTTPRTPLPPVPHTARQGMSAVSGVPGIDDPPPSTEEPYPTFVMSTILPRFLFLGPELTEEDHVRQLQDAGVKRILNLAIECDENDHGLRLAERFERYSKIPMRDTVEEENIVRGVREACDILDDASLHSAPTYVHCKAGKSRSVTAVMAYLIHANHWTLSRAYAFVLERRRGISPNIGFVSELMNFEEMELGGKSVGVVKEPQSADRDPSEGGAPGMGMGVGYASAAGARRPAHLRESLPPAFTLSADQVLMVGVGDVGQETEVRDASGRYRHARRAPVDENTLQPLRRVSKAGLESALHADFL